MGKKTKQTPNCPFCCCFCAQETMDKIYDLICCRRCCKSCKKNKNDEEDDKLIQNEESTRYGTVDNGQTDNNDDNQKTTLVQIKETSDVIVTPIPALPIVHESHVTDKGDIETAEEIVEEHKNEETDIIEESEIKHGERLETPPPGAIHDRAESATYSRLSMSTTSPEIIATDSEKEDKKDTTIQPKSVVDIDKPKTHKIVFMGRVNSGKSTTICGLAQYYNWADFDDAKNQMIQLSIPIKFCTNDNDENQFIIKGIDDTNEDKNASKGHTKTQKPKIHSFKLDDDYLDVIDTPGINDIHGNEQDKLNIDSIIDSIHNIETINAICIILNLEDNNDTLKVILEKILTNFSKDVVNNLVFVLTHQYNGENEDFKSIERINYIIHNIIKINDIILDNNNTFFVNNNGLKYLIFKQEDVHHNADEDKAKNDWESTSLNIKNLYKHIKQLLPINNQIIIKHYHLIKTTNDFLTNYYNNEEKFYNKNEILTKLSSLMKHLVDNSIIIDKNNDFINNLINNIDDNIGNHHDNVNTDDLINDISILLQSNVDDNDDEEEE